MNINETPFDLGPDFYDPDSITPRVPWANEPGCGSCHTGYATDNLAGDPDALVSPSDTLGNSDGKGVASATPLPCLEHITIVVHFSSTESVGYSSLRVAAPATGSMSLYFNHPVGALSQAR